ncbi:PREDICTED: uncharacterized protein LOC109156819 [Ipomoea nil]|uniref:uncharacterized protein LOC109156819 n=1 Tax=Ipomoea nil TaxID=35883 RepID=UPI000901EA47|nr:PREDICTED: uncharacterized protein LOC109156819 [Ipomoea nil]
MGGIGKTTIAMAVFSKFSSQFVGACFLENISLQKGNIIELQKTLLQKILKERSPVDISNVDDGIKMIKNRLSGKKVLIVLDDVDNPLEQSEKLAGGHDWFGEGSRVIITTRNRGVFRSHRVDEKYIYEVDSLVDQEAIQLFSWYAFGKKIPDTGYEQLSLSIVSYAMGLPLALKVLGSSLCGLKDADWKITLKQLKGTLPNDIYAKLKISYDRLDSKNKEMFLHIACFFRNRREEDVKDALECDVRLLIERCLVSVKNGKFEMHDLIQEMGWHIARQEKRRRRVWQLEDVKDVLRGNLKSKHIEGILFPSTDEWNNDENIRCAIEAFKHMKKLKILIVDGDVKIFHDMDNYLCSSELRWLDFKNYGFTSLQITKNFDKLAYLGLRQSYSLLESPNFARMPNLKRLNLSYCPKLKGIHSSVGNLRRLVSLDLSGCFDLEKLPSFNQVSSLKFLGLRYCQNLKKFPEIKTSMLDLVELDLEEVWIKELPSSIQQLHGLTKLCLIRCQNLVCISNGLCKLENLKVLKITCCRKIVSLPLNGLTSLKYLNLQGSGFVSLPRSFSKLCNLQYLDITSCRNLEKLPKLPASMKELYVDCHFGFGSNIFELAIKCSELYSISFCCEDQFEVGTSLAMKFIPFPLYRKNPFSFSYPIPKADILRSFKYRRYGAHNGISINLSNSWYSKNFWGFAICFRPLTGDMWRPHPYQDIDGHMEHCVIIAKLSHKDNKIKVLQRECVIVGSKELGFYIDGHMCFVNIPFTSLWDGSKTTMDGVTPNDYSRFEVASVNLEASAYYWGCSLLYHERKKNKIKKCITISRVSCEALENEVNHEICINGLQVPKNVCTLLPAMGSITCIGSNTCITLVQIEDYTNFMWTNLASWDGNLPGRLTTKIGHLTECISRLHHYHYLDCTNDFRRCERKHQLPANIRELYACHTMASESNIAELATKYLELHSVSFSHGVVTLSASVLAEEFSHITDLLNRNTPFAVTYTTTDEQADINMRWFKYSSHASNKISIDLNPTWYNQSFMGFVVCFLFSGREIWESDLDIHPFRHCEIIAKLAHGNKVVQKKIMIGRLYNEEFDFTFGDRRLICFAYIPFSSLWNESNSIMDNVAPNHYSIFEVTFLDLEVSTDWSCDLLYTTEAKRLKWEQEQTDSGCSDSGLDRTKLWQLTKTVHLAQSKMVSKPECSNTKVVQLFYTNSGVGILALSSNGILKLWKCSHDEQNPSGEPWKPNGGPSMKAIPCMALSKDDSYVVSAGGEKVSLFDIMEFKVKKRFMWLPSASTFLAFHPHDNNTIAIGTKDSTIYIYDVRLDKVRFMLHGHVKRITGLAFSTNYNILVSSGADARLCVWSTDTWQERKSVCIYLFGSGIQVMFHADQLHLLVTHETQLAIYDASEMKCIRKWIPCGSLSAPISSATYSCNSQLVYASFKDGNIGVLDADSLRLRCRIAPSAYLSQAVLNDSGAVFQVVIAAHPQEPIQFAIGLTDGSVIVIELLKSKVKWKVSLAVDNHILNEKNNACGVEDRHGFGEVIFGDDDEVSSYEELQMKNCEVRERLQEYSVDYVVGFDGEAKAIKDRLTKGSEDTTFISIVGMAGLGKTTLTKMIFYDTDIHYEFFTKLWVHVSRSMNRKQIFMDIISRFTKQTDDFKNVSEELLAKRIKKYLKSGKYFIVMDDVWHKKDWDLLKIAFPDNYNGSRVLVTTRDTGVATHADSYAKPHNLKFLKNEESLELLQKKVFRNEAFPEYLESPGRKIAAKCNGLPLAIVIIASFLRNNDQVSSWNELAENRIPILSPGYNGILRLSYNQLPNHIKDCFLYLAVFPMGHEISVWKLIRLWIAEGFIPPVSDSTMERTADSYLKEIVSRNLLMVVKRRADGDIKTCRLHDTLHEFCKDEAVKNYLFHEINGARIERHDKYRRLCIRSSIKDFIGSKDKPSGEHICSLLTSDHLDVPKEHLATIPKAYPFLKVFDGENLYFENLPKEFYQLYLLRYLAISTDLNILPKPFTDQWNMQTLVFNTSQSSVDVKAEIWNLTKLRHIIANAPLQFPTPKNCKDKCENLQTLSPISPESCTKAILEKMPNLLKLGVRGNLVELLESEGGGVYLFDNVRKLHNLQNLKLVHEPANDQSSTIRNFPQDDKFPSKLRQLTLSNTSIDWKHICVLGSLNELEVLKLKNQLGEYWDVNNTVFKSLRILHIGRTNLVRWTCEKSSFPVLNKLYLSHCTSLEAVPLAFKDVKSLKFMELFCTNKNVAASAITIREQKQKDGFDLSIYPPDH